MIFWVPYARVTLESRHTVDEVLRRFRDDVEPHRWLRNPFSRKHKTFQGQIVGLGFRIRRIIHYNNSFLPVVRGEVRPGGLGARVEITMRLEAFVIGFLCVWFGMLFLFAAMGLAHGIRETTGIVGIFGLFGYLLTTIAFSFEASRALGSLRTLLAAKDLST